MCIRDRLDLEIAENLYEIKDPIYICEINLDFLFSNKKESQKMIRRFDFPAIKREYAFLVPKMCIRDSS